MLEQAGEEGGNLLRLLVGADLPQILGLRGLDRVLGLHRGRLLPALRPGDAENYRLKREQSLQHLAHKVAAKVVKYKRNVTLEPMNAYERHVIKWQETGIRKSLYSLYMSFKFS